MVAGGALTADDLQLYEESKSRKLSADGPTIERQSRNGTYRQSPQCNVSANDCIDYSMLI